MSAFDDDVADFDLDQPAPFTASKPVPVPAELVDELRDVLAEPTPYGGNVIRVARALVDAVERPRERWYCDQSIGEQKDGTPAPPSEPLCRCGHDKAAHEYEYSPVKGHCSHGGTNGVPECRCAKFTPPRPSISDEAEAREELRQLAAAYLAAWGGGIPKLWHDAFTALGIEPMGDIQAAFDLAQSLAAGLDRATKENNHE